jgi:hypothetical protein
MNTKTITAAALALVLGATQAKAYTGNELLADCTASLDTNLGPQNSTYCLGYLLGHIEKSDYVPVGVTAGQARDIMVAYLQQHPETRHLPAQYNAFMALRAAFGLQAQR